MPRDHVIDPVVVHHQWDANLEPTLRCPHRHGGKDRVKAS
jgi:hypothetical protein